MKAAKAGASLSIGIDISRVSVETARHSANSQNLENIMFLQADAENTRFPDSCIDVIVCSGMLHHLDLNFAFPELSRILAPNGKILAIEALDYNPLIKLYRLITPDMRTEWEKSHILSLKDLKFAENFFDVGDVNYWHVISYAGAYLPKLMPLLEATDSFLTKIPFVKRLAWIFTFELLSKKYK
jgi:ubiquinone/menaquinone biosynthesis C-methylase UbiE